MKNKEPQHMIFDRLTVRYVTCPHSFCFRTWDTTPASV
jgi:hypothetical protein